MEKRLKREEAPNSLVSGRGKRMWGRKKRGTATSREKKQGGMLECNLMRKGKQGKFILSEELLNYGWDVKSDGIARAG